MCPTVVYALRIMGHCRMIVVSGCMGQDKKLRAPEGLTVSYKLYKDLLQGGKGVRG